MKRLFLALLIVVFLPFVSFAEDTLSPPKGNCKEGEVNRCTLGMCMTNAVYRPIVFEDGKAVPNNYNDTHCDWDCVCVPKEKQD